MIERVLDPPDQAGFCGAIDEADGTVVPEQERGSNVADGRPSPIGRAAHCEQELMLRSGDPKGLSLFLAPTEEAAQLRPERQEPLIVRVREVVNRHGS